MGWAAFERALMPLIDYIGPGFGLGGAAIGAAGVWHAKRTETNATKEDSERDDKRENGKVVDERWQAMLEQQRKDFELMVNGLRADLEAVRSDVGGLRRALDRLQPLYQAAIAHIKHLHRVWPGPGVAPSPPSVLDGEL